MRDNTQRERSAARGTGRRNSAERGSVRRSAGEGSAKRSYRKTDDSARKSYRSSDDSETGSRRRPATAGSSRRASSSAEGSRRTSSAGTRGAGRTAASRGTGAASTRRPTSTRSTGTATRGTSTRGAAGASRGASSRGTGASTRGASTRGTASRGTASSTRSYGKSASFDRENKYGKKLSGYRKEETKAAKPVIKTAEDGVRLNKFISNSGICSRREADDYITAGVVSVNDVVVTELGTKVFPNDIVKFNGERIKGEEKVYIVMNKPKDFVTTVSDPYAEKTVVGLVQGKCKERVYPVGRLDKATTGVLLLTNDGELADKLTHPSFEKKKIYHVTLDKNVKATDMSQLVKGVVLEDGPISVDEISYVDDDKTQVGVEIHSGRNRIVRRMFEHFGYKVKKLDRVYFAGLTKKNLRRGQWRFLTEQEVAMLKIGSYE